MTEKQLMIFFCSVLFMGLAPIFALLAINLYGQDCVQHGHQEDYCAWFDDKVKE